MSDHLYIAKEPYVPFKWLIAILGFLLPGVFYFVSWKQDVGTRLEASEQRQDRLAEAYRRQDLKLDLLLEKSGRIEGLLEGSKKR